MHGCVELRTERLILRRYRPEDADDLYHYLGTDPAMYEHSGWNPYATLELAQETVRRFIDCYKDGHTYSWVMDMGADLGVLFQQNESRECRIHKGLKTHFIEGHSC